MDKWLEDIKNKPIEYLIDIYAEMLSYSKAMIMKMEIEKGMAEQVKAYQLKEVIWQRVKGC
jgi:hypothetical protein